MPLVVLNSVERYENHKAEDFVSGTLVKNPKGEILQVSRTSCGWFFVCLRDGRAFARIECTVLGERESVTLTQHNLTNGGLRK